MTPLVPPSPLRNPRRSESESESFGTEHLRPGRPNSSLVQMYHHLLAIFNRAEKKNNSDGLRAKSENFVDILCARPQANSLNMLTHPRVCGDHLVGEEVEVEPRLAEDVLAQLDDLEG